ncbi:MAG: FAD:protein FMN transferase [Acidimicrobiales bacterium]
MINPCEVSPPIPPEWERVDVGSTEAGCAERRALGTVVRLVVCPPTGLAAAALVVEAELRRLDLEASRFRSDSEISRLHARGAGFYFVSRGLAEAVGVALGAARWTEGRVDPTVGNSLIALGYDRDFVELPYLGGPANAVPAAGWRSVGLEGRLLRLPGGLRLDLGATAKGLGADRSARVAARVVPRPGGVLVSLGGDLAVAGQTPRDGWPILVTESSESRQAGLRTQVVRLHSGALATSSVSVRKWRRGGREMHHIVDPATGRPADGPWRTATVAAPKCARANAAATAAIVAGTEAEEWLESTGLPARLVAKDGSLRLVNGWPEGEEGHVDPGADASRAPVGAFARAS